MRILLQSIKIVEDFLPLELGSSDVILGMKWLKTLGSMAVNWKTLTMKFKVGETPVLLQGDYGLCKIPVSPKVMIRALHREGQGLWLEFSRLQWTKWKEKPGVENCLQKWQRFCGSEQGVFLMLTDYLQSESATTPLS